MEIDIVREMNNIPNDGFVTQSNDNPVSPMFFSIYTPRGTRRNLNVLNDDGTRFFGSNDLRIENGVEVDNIRHSPVIGWSYDGVPIYGPYGLPTPRKVWSNRWSLVMTVLTIKTIDLPDQSILVDSLLKIMSLQTKDLDEHNGRFCVTPDYPNGVYGYYNCHKYSRFFWSFQEL